MPYTIHQWTRRDNQMTSSLDVAIAATCPVRGTWFFLTSPEFWLVFFKRLPLISLLSATYYHLVYNYVFPRQYELFQKYHGQGAFINAVALTLSECLVLIQVIHGGHFLDQSRVDVFDATLIKLSHYRLISPLRKLNTGARNAVAMLGEPKATIGAQPWNLYEILDMLDITREEYRKLLGMQLLIYLPLHFIPYVGTPAFFVFAGHAYAQFLQRRWCQVRGLSEDAEHQEAQARWWEYAAFGSVALALQLIPLFSFPILLMNSAGSAIWGLQNNGAALE